MPEPIRYYFDQHIPGAAASGLRLHGVDVLTAQEANRCGLSDSDQLAFATAEARVLVTFDSDYLALHRNGAQHSGIAWCPATKQSIGQLLARYCSCMRYLIVTRCSITSSTSSPIRRLTE